MGRGCRKQNRGTRDMNETLRKLRWDIRNGLKSSAGNGFKPFPAFCLFAGLALLAAAPMPALAAGGDLIWEKSEPNILYAYDLALDSTGVYIVGEYPLVSPVQWRIEKRDLTTGNLITTFGSSGIINLNLSPSTSEAYGVAVDSTGIYIAGRVYGGALLSAQWRIEKRRLDTGALCTAANCGTEFGVGGIITVDGGNAWDIAVDSTGIYVAGDNSVSPVRRIEKRDKTTGNLITTFGSSGIASLTCNPGFDSLAVDSVGLYIAGTGGGASWCIEKIDKTTGNPITTFGSSGVVSVNVAGTETWDTPRDIAIDSLALYLVGYVDGQFSDYKAYVEKRDLTTGNLIIAFDLDGAIVINNSPSGWQEYIEGIAVDPSGIYIGGLSGGVALPMFIQKRDLTNGNSIWNKSESGGGGGTFGSMAVDSTGVYSAHLIAGKIDKRELSSPPPPPPTVNLTAFPTTINSGWSSDLTWLTSDATSCNDVEPPDWIAGPVGGDPGGSQTVWPVSTTTYTIECTGPGSPPTAQQSAIVTVTAPPTCGDLDTSFDTDGIVTSDPSGNIDAAFTITIDSTYMYVGGSDKSPGNNQWRIEKRRLNNGAICTAPNCGTEFGTGGAATSNMGQVWDRVNSIALDASFLYAAGYDLSSGSGDGRWRIEKRRIDNGALCTAANCGTAFDTDGVVTTDPSVSRDRATGISIDFTYMYIVGDDSSPGAFNQQWRIEKRRLDTGLLCTAANCGTAFDTDGIAISNPSAFLADQPYAIAIDSSYMYVVGFDSNTVTSNYQWRIEKRRLDTGALCTAPNCGTEFGTGGAATSDPSNSTDIAYAIAIDSNYMYVVGSDASPGYFRWHIEKRSLATGALVAAFDTDGIVTSSPCAANAVATSVAVDSTDIYVMGYDSCTGGEEWRLEKRDISTGALDAAFGVSGVVLSNPTTSSSAPPSIAIDSNAIYVAGVDGGGGYQWHIEKRILSCTGGPPLPTITLDAVPPTIDEGQTSTLTWTSTDAASCAAFSPAGWITADGGDGVGGCDNPGPDYLNGCQVVSPTSTTIYTIQCVNAVGDPAQQSVTVTVNAPPAGNDCGMRVFDGTSTITLDCETPATTTSLRIHKNGTTSGIKLVDPADHNASRLRIQTPSGVKALRKQ